MIRKVTHLDVMEIALRTLRDSGCTYDLSTGRLYEGAGYGVSRENGQTMPLPRFGFDHLFDDDAMEHSQDAKKLGVFVAQIAHRMRAVMLAHPGVRLIGTWVSDGIVYIDATDVYASREAANDALVKNNQLAGFDFGKREVFGLAVATR